jgi:hypothetical protein
LLLGVCRALGRRIDSPLEVLRIVPRIEPLKAERAALWAGHWYLGAECGRRRQGHCALLVRDWDAAPICASGVGFLCDEPPAAGHNPGFLDEELPDKGVLRY